MKALSVQQPFADQIYGGEKWLEFRSKPTTHRGRLLICASRSVNSYAVNIGGKEIPLPTGKMLCVVDLVDCRPMTGADKKHPGAPSKIGGWYAWEFGETAVIAVPKNITGRVGLFNVPDEEIEYAPEGKFWFDYLD